MNIKCNLYFTTDITFTLSSAYISTYTRSEICLARSYQKEGAAIILELKYIMNCWKTTWSNFKANRSCWGIWINFILWLCKKNFFHLSQLHNFGLSGLSCLYPLSIVFEKSFLNENNFFNYFKNIEILFSWAHIS